MKRKRRVYFYFLLVMALIYVGLLLILYLTEATSDRATIHTFGDAFWYSLVTLSTVGYGDVSPVTPLGRLIGILFLIMSTGILVTLFGTVVSLFAGETIPLWILGRNRKKNWYYFADCGTESTILAGNIVKEDKDAIIIFGEKRDEKSEALDYPCVFLNTSPAKIVKRKKNIGTKCKIFFLREDDIGTNSRAEHLADLPVEIYARTSGGNVGLQGKIHLFHSYDCCARQYWRSKPLCFQEEKIVIIGFGSYGRAILERAILINVLSCDQHVEYHIFGDAEEFLAIHNQLSKVFSINEESESKDSLIFHTGFWGDEHKLLETADRIIICEDDAGEGWDIYGKIQLFYRTTGRIDVRSNRKAPDVSYFGTNEEIYTPEQILRTKLNEAAITINELFQKSVSHPTKSWEELDDFHRESKIAAADHLLMKSRILLRDETITKLTAYVLSRAYKRYLDTKDRVGVQEEYRKIDHLRWRRFYTYYNWEYGPRRDDRKKQHPMLRPYEELTREQQKERDLAWELIDNISVELKLSEKLEGLETWIQ